MTINSNVKILDTVFLQEVDEETILLDSNTEEYFSLNEVGGIFYNILLEETSLVKVLDILNEHFDIPISELKKDLLNFIDTLDKKGLVDIV